MTAQSSRETYHKLKKAGVIQKQLEYALIQVGNLPDFTYHDIMSLTGFLQCSSARVLNNLKESGYATVKGFQRGDSTVQVLKLTKKGRARQDYLTARKDLLT